MRKGDRITVRMTQGGLIPGSDGKGTAQAKYLSQDGSLIHLEEFWGGRKYTLNTNSLFFVSLEP